LYRLTRLPYFPLLSFVTGPCTEIHYDRIGDRDAAALVNADDANVIEIWNLVFIQYNRESDGMLKELPAQHVDTGMGLERLTSILQQKSSNYDIDCFQSIFEAIEKHSTVGQYEGRLGNDDTNLKDTAYRAIADHARTLSFAIADGAVPSNEGRGYVLRRVFRRAARYGQQILGASPGFFAELVPVVVQEFGEFYPELRDAQSTIVEVIQEEEASFSSMLDRGIKYFEEMEQDIKGAGGAQVSGEKAFFLYDTLGFPLDLTELMALEAGMTVDAAGFESEMKAQKDRSRAAQRAARAAGGVNLELLAEQTAWLVDQGIRRTDDTYKYLNYEWNVELPAGVVAVYGDTGFLKEGQAAEEGDFVGIILDISPFYPESGGQVADTGTMVILDDDQKQIGEFAVADVQAYAGYILHTGFVESGRFPAGVTVTCKVDYERRRRIAPNHSMTHVLNAALRKVLGDKADQKGSLCNDEKLRFDFSHKQALTTQQLKEVEEFCQQVVQQQLNVTIQTLPLDEAKAIAGVRAVFGEVYPDPVRVVSVGNDTSVEFCGGTHVANIKEAEAFALLEETAVAKGIRRITAVTKEAAVKALEEGERFESLVTSKEKLDADETLDLDKQAGAIRKELDAAFMSASIKAELRARIEALQKKAGEAKKRQVQKRVDIALNDIRKDIEAAASSDKRSLVLSVDIRADSKASQRVMNTVKELAPDMAFLGVTEEEPGSGGKVMAFALVPDALVAGGLTADEWVKVALESCGGRGGGKSGSAQGQAKECADVEAVVKAAETFAETKLQALVA
jgi:alanyl-tRNA synthetase